MPTSPTYAFFGSSTFSVITLEKLAEANMLPSLVVTMPDKPQGRKMIVASPPAKVWADAHNIKTLQPATLKDPAIEALLKKQNWDIFIVASYGKIIPKTILDIPAHGTLNVHPSLLPLFRGPSPIQSSILEDEKETGVSIIILDEQVDHGPVITKEEISVPNWPLPYAEFERILAEHGGALLAATLPRYIRGEVSAVPQDDGLATYTKKIEKSDGLLDLAADPYKNWLKIQAFREWPGTYFKTMRKDKEIRVIIVEAEYKNNVLEIIRVKPGGGKEMRYEDFKRGL